MTSFSRFQKTAAREMRKDQTPHEWRLWHRLRSRRLGGFKFRRQHPVGRYIVDFACVRWRLVVEVDGDSHEAERDEKRDRWMSAEGWRVLRFTNDVVDEDIESVVAAIHSALGELSGVVGDG